MAHTSFYWTSQWAPICLSHFDSNVCCPGKLSLRAKSPSQCLFMFPNKFLLGLSFQWASQLPGAETTCYLSLNHHISSGVWHIIAAQWLLVEWAMDKLCFSNMWTTCGGPELSCEGRLFVPPSSPPLPVSNSQPKFMSDTPLSLQGCMIDLLLFFPGSLEGSLCHNVGVSKV